MSAMIIDFATRRPVDLTKPPEVVYSTCHLGGQWRQISIRPHFGPMAEDAKAIAKDLGLIHVPQDEAFYGDAELALEFLERHNAAWEASQARA